MANLSATSRSLPRSMVEAGAVTLDHLASFRIIYVAIFAYVMLSVVSIELAEGLLDRHFNEAIARAVRVDPADGAIAPQIQERVSAVLRDSAWTRIGAR